MADTGRRQFLKAAALLCLFSGEASAKTNVSLRQTFQYQGMPKDGMSCSNCLEFIAGDKDLGRCRVIPGDDEISPNGYCTKWNSM